MMRIAIDAHAIGSRLGGNETYVSELLASLLSTSTDHTFIPYFADEKARAEWVRRFPGLESYVFRRASTWARLSHELTLRTKADRVDLLHVQYSGPLINAVPLVTSVHDTSYRMFPDFFSRMERYLLSHSISRTMAKASKVITISETSRKDIETYHHMDPAKIEVTYLGYDNLRFNSQKNKERIALVRERYSITTPYVLTVGNLQPRKNLVTLLQAFEKLVATTPEMPHRLVLVGKAGYRHSTIFDTVEQSFIRERIVLTDYVPLDDLPDLYRGADLFVYPSLYEGFGLPIVEAMACSVPVVTTTGGALPEIAGGAATLVEPKDVDAMARAMKDILSDWILAKSLRELGTARAREFSWQRTALQTLAVYKAVMT